MKKLLLNSFLVLSLMLPGGALFAQAPTAISYNGGTNAFTFTDGTAGSFSPTTTGGAIPALQYGVVTTPFGSTTGAAGLNNATGNAATFSTPYSVVGDGAGNLYVADYTNNVIRKIVISTGVVTTLATGFSGPAGICIDASATNLYVSDYGPGDIKKIVIATGVVTLIATNNTYGPWGLTLDAAGTNLYFADKFANVIRKVVLSTSTVSIYAGTGAVGRTNSTLAASKFNAPADVAFDASGNLFVADAGNNEIREINAAGTAVTLFAGAPQIDDLMIFFFPNRPKKLPAVDYCKCVF